MLYCTHSNFNKNTKYFRCPINPSIVVYNKIVIIIDGHIKFHRFPPLPEQCPKPIKIIRFFFTGHTNIINVFLCLQMWLIEKNPNDKYT